MNTIDTEIDILPPTEEMKAALATWRPRALALANYVRHIDDMPLGEKEVSKDGMTLRLPDPYQNFPATRAALQRAKGRSATYYAGTSSLFRWSIQLMTFSQSFDYASTSITTIYEQMGAEGPTPEQRTTILKLVADLIAELQTSRQSLVEAETAYGVALQLLAEDKSSLGAEVSGIAAATDALEQTIRDLILKYTLSTFGQGLAKIVQQTGQIQLDQMRGAVASLRQVVDECTQAHQAVALMVGELLTTLTKYQGLEKALKTAEGSTFKFHLQQIRFNIAREQWKSLSEYVVRIF
jgi:hypothetical protein